MDRNVKRIKLLQVRSNTLVLTGDTIYFNFYTYNNYISRSTLDILRRTATTEKILPAGNTWTMEFTGQETEEGRTLRQMTGFPVLLLEPKRYFEQYVLSGYDSGPDEYCVVARPEGVQEYPQIRARINTTTTQFVGVEFVNRLGKVISSTDLGGYSILHNRYGVATYEGIVLPLTACTMETGLQGFMMYETYYDDIQVEVAH
jgi:hypothetical protein